MKKNILFINGIPDSDTIWVQKTHPNGDILSYKYRGLLSNLLTEMNPPDWNKLPALLDAREFPFRFDPATHCIINEITEADTHVKTLDYLGKLLKQHPEIPVINPPEQVKMTRRDRVYETLKDIPGLHVPKTIRFQPRHLNDILDCMEAHDLHYPLILKSAGRHAGVGTLRFENREQLNEGLYPMALDGSSYYLIQFHDTSQNGVFNKFRFATVAGTPYPNHLRYADHWMVHYSNGRRFMAQHPEYSEKEKVFFADYTQVLPAHFATVIQSIYQRIPIDYTGLDFTIDPQTGEIFLFELNPNMLILQVDPPQLPHDVKSVRDIKTAVKHLVDSRITASDSE